LALDHNLIVVREKAMATLSVSISGSTVVSGGKDYTLGDNALLSILSWSQATYFPSSAAPTKGQEMVAWVDGWVNATKDSVQTFETTPPVKPPPIVIVST
jgi:hypothetical protein